MQITRRRLPTRFAPWLFLAVLCLGAFDPAQALDRKQRKAVAEAKKELPEEFQAWLEEVDTLISDQELLSFLELAQDYQRRAFIERFWKARDPYPDTGRNEFRDRWVRRVEEARIEFGTLDDERGRIFLTNGPPAVRKELDCGQIMWPTEIWFYSGSDKVREEFFLVFYQPSGLGRFRLWSSLDGLQVLFKFAGIGTNADSLLGQIYQDCFQGDQIAPIFQGLLQQSQLGQMTFLAELQEKPDPPGGEWVDTFEAYSTELPEDAELIDGAFEVAFPGRRASRTLVQGLVRLPADQVGVAKLAGHRSVNLVLTGEILAGEDLFDTFRYKFDLPAGDLPSEEVASGEPGPAEIPLAFERALRPGTYRMIFKLEDLNGGGFYRVDQELEVPTVEAGAPPAVLSGEAASVLEEANRLLSFGEVSLRIVEPRGQRLMTGYHRFETQALGEIAAVRFTLDSQDLLTKKRPPYSVELDLGALPRPRTLRAVALDADGEELAADELLINADDTRFSVQLVEPLKGKSYQGSLRARAEVKTPKSQPIERVEFFLNETRVATLYQEPFVQPIVLPDNEPIAYVQVVAYLADGNSTQDLVFVNGPDIKDELSIEFVELYSTVVDRQGRPIPDLALAELQVEEDGVAQEIRRFEKVQDRPIHATVLMDISASMDDRLEGARDAALGFFQEILTPKDRGSLIVFNDRPERAVEFTKEIDELAGGLAGLKAERGTALHDSLIFSLYYFNGIRGQRALILLSDGKDESSRFEFDDALEYARRAGVTIYTIGLDLPRGEARRNLSRFAEETGGRAFYVEGAGQLPQVYATIEAELRAQYLIAYQSSNTDPNSGFRSVRVRVDRSGVDVVTSQGYYP